MKRVFIEYVDTDGQGREKIVQGYFELISKEDNRITIRSGKNVLILPDHRWHKIKESNSELKGGIPKK